MTGNLLVSLRNLNTVLSLDAGGGGVQWMLSSSIPTLSWDGGKDDDDATLMPGNGTKGVSLNASAALDLGPGHA